MINYDWVLMALEINGDDFLRRKFQEYTVAEAVEVGTFIGPDRLTRLIARNRLDRPLNQNRNTPPVEHIEYSENVINPPGPSIGQQLEVEATLTAIMEVVYKTSMGIRASPKLRKEITVALANVVARRKIRHLLKMEYDVTNTLPRRGGNPPRLTDQDYADLARRHGVELAAIKAVAQVESGAQGAFDSLNRPVILFEAHKFGGLSRNHFQATNPHLALLSTDWRGSRRYYPLPWDQYQRLEEAMILGFVDKA